MATQNNFNSDLAIRHLMDGKITRVYRDIETNEAKTQQSIADVLSESANIRQMVVDNANTVEGELDTLETSLSGEITATATFLRDTLLGVIGGDYSTLAPLDENATPELIAEYNQKFSLAIQASAMAIAENFNFTSALKITDEGENSQTLLQYIDIMNGQIRRGFIANPDYVPSDPDSKQYLFGIVVSNNVSFNGVKRTEDGYTYWQIGSGQTFGFYTSVGWMFWIDGERRGWFNANDNHLYVYEANAEKLHMPHHDIVDDGAFGIKWVQ